MTDVKHVYEDRWGEIIDRPAVELVELRWYDTTAAMSAAQFQDWLATFARHVERLRRPRVLIDGTRFMMDPANLNDAGRDANIIPRYNAAGVRRFAFLFPRQDARNRRAAGPPRDPPLSRQATSRAAGRRSTGSPPDRSRRIPSTASFRRPTLHSDARSVWTRGAAGRRLRLRHRRSRGRRDQRSASAGARSDSSTVSSRSVTIPWRATWR